MLFYSIVNSLKFMLLEQAKVRKIKGGAKPVFEDKAGACLSLAYNKDKSYLFAGFADGTIRVYKTSNNGEN